MAKWMHNRLTGEPNMSRTQLIAALLHALPSVGTQADEHTPPTLPTTPVTVSLDNPCKGASGGSPTTDNQTIAGNWDPSTGQLSLTITLTACVGPDGATQNGTDAITGTLVAGTNPGDYTINTTEQINTTLTYPKSGGTLTRTCTITRQGNYTGATDTFDGTTTRNNCSLQGNYREEDTRHEIRLLDNLFKRSTEAETQ
jgi:hypothetical protein